MISETAYQALNQLLNTIIPSRRRRARLNARLWSWAAAAPKKEDARAD